MAVDTDWVLKPCRYRWPTEPPKDAYDAPPLRIYDSEQELDRVVKLMRAKYQDYYEASFAFVQGSVSTWKLLSTEWASDVDIERTVEITGVYWDDGEIEKTYILHFYS